MKNPIPDTSTVRRWNLLSDASSSAAIRSLERISVTAYPHAHAACLTHRGWLCPAAAAEPIRARRRRADLKMNDR